MTDREALSFLMLEGRVERLERYLFAATRGDLKLKDGRSLPALGLMSTEEILRLPGDKFE